MLHKNRWGLLEAAQIIQAECSRQKCCQNCFFGIYLEDCEGGVKRCALCRDEEYIPEDWEINGLFEQNT